MRTTAAVLALSVAVQQAAATHGYDWLQAIPYSCPSNTDNHCNQKQESGFDWSGLNPGSFHQYGEMNYKGYQCQNSFGHSKRDVLASRGIQSKCIAGSAGKQPEQNPVISCLDKSFSVDNLQVSTEEDQDLEFTYGYENGATCKHVASCSKGGSTIKNSQCGGAKSVAVGLPPSAPKPSCSFAIHSIGFNCGSASVPVPSSTIVPVVSSHTFPVYSFTIPNNQTTPTVPTPTGTAPAIPPYTSVPGVTPSVPVGTAPTSSPSPPVSTPSVPANSVPESSPSVPASSAPVSSPSVPASSVPESSPSSSTPVATTPVNSPSVPVYSLTTPTPNTPTPSSPESTPSTGQSSTGNSPTGSTSSPVVSSPVSSPTPGTTVPIYTTEVVVTTETTCPVTNTITSGSTTSTQVTTTVSTITSTSTSTVCTQCVPPPASTPTPPAASTGPVVHSSVPVPPASGTGNSPQQSTTTPVAPGTTLLTTEVETTYVTTCPVTNTITTGGSTSYQTTTTVSTLTSTFTSTIVQSSTPPAVPVSTPASSIGNSPAPVPSSSPASSAGNSPAPVPSSSPASSIGNSPVPVSSSSPAPSAPCPTVLPQCMNTWIKLTTCENNAASDCYCTDSSFTKSVQECVSSWAADDKEVQAALSYLAGICAPHVSANPGIITNVPKTITLVPTPATTPAPAGPTSAGENGPAPATPTTTSYTTVSISKTVTLPVTYSTGVSSGSAIPSSYTTSVLNTAATLPQVHFTTANSPVGSSSAPSVGLAAGSPAPAPAYPTGGSVNGAAGYGGPTGATTFASISGKPVNTATSSPIVPFKGAAPKVSSGIFGFAFTSLMSFVFLI